MHENETRFRVRYAETDQMGVVYYANYLIWMELGRVEYCRSIGLRYKEMEAKDGIFLAVAEASCRYLFPARYDEEVVLKTKVTQSGSRMVRFSYEMFEAETGTKLAEGITAHVFCGRDMRPVKLPHHYLALFRS
jgi:acyl-CoA thioester hydrolase